MKNNFPISSEYIKFLSDLKNRIHASQMRAALSVNSELISLYWHIGKSIIHFQKEKGWGSAVVKQLANDLNNAYPGITGFSRTNLFAMRQMYLFFSQISEYVPQSVGQLPWGHIRVILAKIKDIPTAEFYLKASFEFGWSRNILEMQIEQKLHKRQGKAITNFAATLPKSHSDLAQQTLKDPYIFDFLTLGKNAREREIEKQLLKHITTFLLELGKGFAFIGNQYPLRINNKEYYLDLLFYHIKLRCFIVIELKTGEFKPEYAGKVNFYLSAIDDLLRSKTDQPSIGIILCKNKNKIDVEYALRDIAKPIGVSSFRFNDIPSDIQSQLPTAKQLEEELKTLENYS